MLHIRQKRASKGVTFANLQTQASSSKSASASVTTQPATASKSKPKNPKLRHAHNASATTSKRSSQQPSATPARISNRQRRLASLFMALMASSPLPIETDAETLEAAQKASIAPKAQPNPTHKRKVTTTRVHEVRAGRWKRFRFELSLKTRRKGKAKRWEEVELDDMVELRGEERRKRDDMS
ncbi:hypothetical protein BU25DRAFT_236199 [Macroventuria anomochaeta]|uniref:Uncharacterized protein n=1 Tax=Macroventuria anomochaeta TaxID=301207 RepID=A0ACB6RIP5_9PLEO|nr:uncharacterized protein BU25DRAFT_236199 [Macroventuria anomochaeta]KAF2621634.1 hypothetical protein BU25DRAFT_236199 [Macroventuria anomochaeta]